MEGLEGRGPLRVSFLAQKSPPDGNLARSLQRARVDGAGVSRTRSPCPLNTRSIGFLGSGRNIIERFLDAQLPRAAGHDGFCFTASSTNASSVRSSSSSGVLATTVGP